MSIEQRAPQSVCWHEGMLLSPQHFQQNHIYWENQVQWLTLNVGQYRWGIIELKLDEAKLLDGVVYLTRLRAVMPDGLQVDYDARVDEPLEISLLENTTLAEKGRVKVHLTVPIRVAGSASESTDIQRFEVIDGQPVKDDNTGDNELVMQRLKPIFTLQATSQVRAQYVAMPLFEISQPDGGHFKIGEYCPPILGIGADTFLMDEEQAGERKSLQQRLQSCALMMRKKARMLAGFTEEGDKDLGTRVSEQHLRWIRAMVQHLPEFELLSDNANSSPWQVYLALSRVMGSVCELDGNGIPPKLPSYDHDNINPGFSRVLDYVNRLLERVNLSYTSVLFDEPREGLFTILYDADWGKNNLLIELKAEEGTSEAELVEWLSSCRIASESMHGDLKTRRLLGLEAEQVFGKDDTTGVTAVPGNPLMRIKFDAAYIRPGETLMVTCTSGRLKHQQPGRIVLHLPHE